MILKPSGIKGKTQFQILLDYLPDNHKAKWFAGAALNTGEQAMMSVLSTVLSRLNAFIDSEIEQILCFETTVDIEKFCSEKSAIFLVMPEEDNTKHFLISLFIQQYYREMLACADSQGGSRNDVFGIQIKKYFHSGNYSIIGTVRKELWKRRSEYYCG